MVSGPNAIPVLAVAADWRYAMPMCVLLGSVERFLTVSRAVDVYILDCGIGWRNRRRIRKLFRGGKLNLHWRRVNEWRLRHYPTSGHIKAAAYARLLIPDLLPETTSRAVYLDCDTVLMTDIGELWGTDMQGAPLMACQEGDMTLASPGGVARYRELGFEGKEPYLNSGVLLMDLTLWRKERIHKSIFGYLQKYAVDVIFHDQDGINAVLADRWRPLESKWNWRVVCEYNDAEKDAMTQPFVLPVGTGIVHWASKCKPWHEEIGHSSRQFFEEQRRLARIGGGREWMPLTVRLDRYCRYYGRRMKELVKGLYGQ